MTLWSVCTSLTGFIDEVSPSLEEQIAAAKKHGLNGIEVRSAWDKNVTVLTPEELQEIRRQTEGAGLVVSGVGSPVNKVPMMEHHRQAENDKLKKAMEAAHILGTKRVRIFSPSAGDEARQYDLRWILDWMRPQAELAAAAGITLIHENDSRFYGAYPDGAKGILGALGGPNFRHVFDFSNSVMIGIDPLTQWLPWILPHLESLHIKDFSRSSLKIVAAGEGDARIPQCLRFLANHGWKGTVTLEPHLAYAGGNGGFSGEELFGHAVNALKRILDEEITS